MAYFLRDPCTGKEEGDLSLVRGTHDDLAYICRRQIYGFECPSSQKYGASPHEERQRDEWLCCNIPSSSRPTVAAIPEAHAWSTRMQPAEGGAKATVVDGSQRTNASGKEIDVHFKLALSRRENGLLLLYNSFRRLPWRSRAHAT